MTVPLVYVVILNWNRKADTIECISSLMEMSYSNFRILVVDNGSSDGSVEELKASFSSLEMIVNQGNVGVAEGRNIGIRYAIGRGADYLAFIDNDTVVDQHLLSELVTVSETDSQIGMVAPKIYNYWDKNRIASAGSNKCWFPPGRIKLIGLGKEDGPAYDQQKEVEYATGCSLLVKREVFEHVGMFDPAYVYYWDDYDFSARVRKGGYKIIYVPSARLWHKVASTREDPSIKWRRLGKNNVYFYRKHISLTYLVLPVYVLWVVAREMVLGNRRAVRPYLMGVWDGLLERPS